MGNSVDTDMDMDADVPQRDVQTLKAALAKAVVKLADARERAKEKRKAIADELKLLQEEVDGIAQQIQVLESMGED